MDTWPLGQAAGMLNSSHLTLDDRKKCCEGLIKRLCTIDKSDVFYSPEMEGNSFEDIHVLVDGMENKFKALFAAWPLRFFVVEKRSGTVTFLSEHPGGKVETETLKKYFEKNFELEAKK